jgi:hypothetical protein
VLVGKIEAATGIRVGFGTISGRLATYAHSQSSHSFAPKRGL